MVVIITLAVCVKISLSLPVLHDICVCDPIGTVDLHGLAVHIDRIDLIYSILPGSVSVADTLDHSILIHVHRQLLIGSKFPYALFLYREILRRKPQKLFIIMDPDRHRPHDRRPDLIGTEIYLYPILRKGPLKRIGISALRLLVHFLSYSIFPLFIKIFPVKRICPEKSDQILVKTVHI